MIAQISHFKPLSQPTYIIIETNKNWTCIGTLSKYYSNQLNYSFYLPPPHFMGEGEVSIYIYLYLLMELMRIELISTVCNTIILPN